MTTVTIIIPTYNRCDVISRAIESVLTQTFGDYELVIVDDGSTDGSLDLIRRYSNEEKRVRYVAHDQNRGPSAARNTGIKAANGSYISFLDSDDKLKPEFLERSVSELERRPDNYAASYVSIEQYEDGKLVGMFESEPTIFSSNNVQSRHLDAGKWQMGGVTCRRSALTDIGLLDERFDYLEDADYWIRLLRSHRCVGIDEPLYEHHRNVGDVSINRTSMIHGINLFIHKHDDILSENATAYCRCLLAKMHILNGEFLKGVIELRNALETDPKQTAAHYFPSSDII